MLVILDRDGVINEESKQYIKNPSEWIPIPGSLEAIAMLKEAGFLVAIATNQSGLGRGLYTVDILDKIHDKMYAALRQLGTTIDCLYYCPHLPNANCSCRKPQPGLLLAIKNHLNCDLKSAYFIGDSLGDIQAAHQVGAKPILVLTGNGKITSEALEGDTSVLIRNNLIEAAHFIIAQ